MSIARRIFEEIVKDTVKSAKEHDVVYNLSEEIIG
jgi:hypothetical protein